MLSSQSAKWKFCLSENLNLMGVQYSLLNFTLQFWQSELIEIETGKIVANALFYFKVIIIILNNMFKCKKIMLFLGNIYSVLFV